MSEYKKLDEWFPDGKPDGRKFELKNSPFIVEPKFRSCDGVWWSLNQHDYGSAYGPSYLYKEYIAPKQTKKVKMYSPVYKRLDGSFISADYFFSDKVDFKNMDAIAGWIDIDVEIEL